VHVDAERAAVDPRGAQLDQLAHAAIELDRRFERDTAVARRPSWV
jgi:hypothetical protein